MNLGHKIIAGSDIGLFVFPSPDDISIMVFHNYGASTVTFDEIESEFYDVPDDLKIKYAERLEQMAQKLRKELDHVAM